MPRFTYQCEDHGSFQISMDKRLPEAPCRLCSKPSKSMIRVGTSVVFERLDNGAMAKAVERMHDIEELIEQRNTSVNQDEPDPNDDQEGD